MPKSISGIQRVRSDDDPQAHREVPEGSAFAGGRRQRRRRRVVTAGHDRGGRLLDLAVVFDEREVKRHEQRFEFGGFSANRVRPLRCRNRAGWAFSWGSVRNHGSPRPQPRTD